jgi:hypothetical protein
MSEKEKDALVTENQQLKDEVERLRTENRNNQDAETNYRQLRQPFIDGLVKDSKGAFDTDDLMKLSISDLTLLRQNFNNSVARDYAVFLDEREQKHYDSVRKLGTLGNYNSETKQYEDGI